MVFVFELTVVGVVDLLVLLLLFFCCLELERASISFFDACPVILDAEVVADKTVVGGVAVTVGVTVNFKGASSLFDVVADIEVLARETTAVIVVLNCFFSFTGWGVLKMREKFKVY